MARRCDHAEVIADSVVRDRAPSTVLDVGCGTGVLLAEFAKRNVSVQGLEYSDVAIGYCRSRNIAVEKFDLEADRLPAFDRRFDIAVSFEVAEHLEERYADQYVALLCRSAPLVFFTAAVPGQGGTDHVNEQPNEYWIEKFAAQGYSYESSATYDLRSEWAAKGVSPWYAANLMIFAARADG